ncbi:D-glycerate dehydrogenase [Crocosphaera sp. UHCC 0190]|uniref:2-hydroxyacid dehydrogenase n=1 Tax=Crocosphaera sp. UHCC 0190 TaxID=3110246 RepID=UPI002B20C78F|nr:D-glycerate dehydrogenase [Crocosphaera sp. UHCC 0190]MEA5511775.1 D-glycerate dehydrogenase [Crocosphaera sp. UHCC 0190]
MSKPKVFITRQIPQAGLDLLKDKVDLEIWEKNEPPPYSILLDKVQEVEGLLCLLTDQIDQQLINQAPHLKVISQMAVGYDNIDINTATIRGIPVGHTPGVLTEATADLTWALLMAITRRITEAQEYIKQGKWTTWQPMGLLGADFVGATLGIIGLGRIGQAVARRGKGFNLKVIYHKPRRLYPKLEQELGVNYVSFEQLLKESDFISLHTPLTERTYHLIGENELKLMKQTAFLINTARGGIIDQNALCYALQQGQIAGAALDVTEPEPLPKEHQLLTLSNVIVTPHIGSASYQTRFQMAIMAAQNLLAGLQGQPLPNCVNPNIY